MKLQMEVIEVEKDSLLIQSPLEKIVSLVSSSESAIDERSVEIKNAARYLLSSVDELSSFSGELREPRPENVTSSPVFDSHIS